MSRSVLPLRRKPDLKAFAICYIFALHNPDFGVLICSS
jgi:hypothetical protein